MKLIPHFERLNSGENNSRTVKISVDDAYRDKNIRIGFITPMGKVFITDDISLYDGEGEYSLPYELLDGKGMLLSQLIVYEGENFIIKSPVYEFPVYRSVDDEDCPCVTSDGIKSLAFLYELILSKSDKTHSHNDIYYTENETDAKLQVKADKEHRHNDIYYTENEMDALLAEKADAGHTHDGSYYSKTETDNLLSEKAEKWHAHNDFYYTEHEVDTLMSQKAHVEHDHGDMYAAREELNALSESKSDKNHNHDEIYLSKSDAEARFEEKSDKTHNHDQLYATKTEAEMLRVAKSDKDHLHRWDEIKDRPGTDREEWLLTYTLSEPDRDNQGRWCQYYSNTPDVTLGETVRVRINFNGIAYERDCKVLSDDGCMYGIPFNNSVYSEESIDNGTYDYDAEPIESGVPSLLLYMVPGQNCEIMADRDYTGADIDIIRLHPVKLGNHALNVTDEACKDNDFLITSGGVFAAMSSAAVTSVNGKKGDVLITADDISHTHRWDEIKDRPGTDKEELLLTYTLSEPDRDNQGRWCQYFGKAPDVILGETVRVRINFNGTAYERDCKVLSDDGCMYGIPFNNSVYSEETIDDGTCDYDTEPVESGVPSLLLYMVPGQSCEIMADRDYTGADIDVIRLHSVKLGNEALYVTDKVTKGSDVLITSGGVFDAMSSAGAGAVTSVNGHTGEVNLTASDVGALPDSTPIPTVPGNISAFNNDTGYISASDVDSVPVMGSTKPVSSGGVYEALEESGKVKSVNGRTGEVNLTAADVGALPDSTPIPTVPGNLSAFKNDTGYIKSSEVDSVPVSGSTKPVSSGGVYTAIEGAGKVKSVNGKTGEVNLTASDVGALPDSIVLPTVPGNISAFNNDAGYISASDVDSIPVKGSSKPVSSGSVYDALFEIDAGMGTLVPPVTSVNGKTGDVVLSAEDMPHIHYWHEIELRPGTGSEELRASYSLDELIYIEKSHNCWYQSFDIAPDFVSGESVRVRIKLSGSDSFYERDCTVLSENGYYHGISFNNSAYSEKTIDDSSVSHTAVPVDSDVPSFLLIFVPGSSCEVYADKDYTGAVIELAGTVVKLSNEALYVTDEVTMDSDYLITSGGVYDALTRAGDNCFVINARCDLTTLTVTEVSNTIEEIIAAYNKGQQISLRLDMTEYDVSLPMVVFGKGAYVSFECALLVDMVPYYVAVYILDDNSVNANMTPLQGS